MVGATTVVILDPSNEVIESNEGNNSLSTLLAIPTLPIPCTPTPTRTPFAT